MSREFNMPPGVSTRDIPGNESEDEAPCAELEGCDEYEGGYCFHCKQLNSKCHCDGGTASE